MTHQAVTAHGVPHAAVCRSISCCTQPCLNDVASLRDAVDFATTVISMVMGSILTGALPASSRIKTWIQGCPVGDIANPTPGTVEPTRHPRKRKAADMAN